MKLNELETLKVNRKRIGRGPGSGTGKTSGKGHKGQKSLAHVAYLRDKNVEEIR